MYSSTLPYLLPINCLSVPLSFLSSSLLTTPYLPCLPLPHISFLSSIHYLPVYFSSTHYLPAIYFLFHFPTPLYFSTPYFPAPYFSTHYSLHPNPLPYTSPSTIFSPASLLPTTSHLLPSHPALLYLQLPYLLLPSYFFSSHYQCSFSHYYPIYYLLPTCFS